MGLSEYLQMKRLEKEATDIRETLRQNGGHTAESAKQEMKANKKDYKKSKGKRTLTDAEKRALIRQSKAKEKELTRLAKEAKKKKK